MKRWPLFLTAARTFLSERVRVTASVSSGAIGGTVKTEKPVVITDMRCSIQPRGAFGKDTVLGQYTDASEVMFCEAMDENGAKRELRRGYGIEEIDGRRRKWEVTDDAENYADVFLVVPLRPARMVR